MRKKHRNRLVKAKREAQKMQRARNAQRAKKLFERLETLVEEDRQASEVRFYEILFRQFGKTPNQIREENAEELKRITKLAKQKSEAYVRWWKEIIHRKFV